MPHITSEGKLIDCQKRETDPQKCLKCDNCVSANTCLGKVLNVICRRI